MEDSEFTIRNIDVLCPDYHRLMQEVIDGDIHTPCLHPESLAVYPELKQLQERARTMGYDLDAELAGAIEADSDANAAH